jgi:hypothetical protein
MAVWTVAAAALYASVIVCAATRVVPVNVRVYVPPVGVPEIAAVQMAVVPVDAVVRQVSIAVSSVSNAPRSVVFAAVAGACAKAVVGVMSAIEGILSYVFQVVSIAPGTKILERANEYFVLSVRESGDPL